MPGGFTGPFLCFPSTMRLLGVLPAFHTADWQFDISNTPVGKEELSIRVTSLFPLPLDLAQVLEF
jgi:hypothetical protein